MKYIAHIRQADLQKQLLSDHLKNVQNLAEQYGAKIGIPHVTGLAGMLHDMGKYSDAFQEYLEEAVMNPNLPPRRGSVDHSTAGGKYLMETFHDKYSFLVECVANAIYSHHGQLKDMINVDGESPFLKRKDYKDDKAIEYEKVKERFFQDMYSQEYLSEYVDEAAKECQQIAHKLLNIKKVNGKEFNVQFRKVISFITLYTFSALLDADRTDSRQFEENSYGGESYNTKNIFEDFKNSLECYLEELTIKAIPNEVTQLRQQMSNMCRDKGNFPTGIYTLSIPTGGGKTLASLRFALHHALKHSKERIIYVVPYTTIIEQNAEEVRKRLNAEDYLLEHHSNVIEDENRDDEQVDFITYQRRKQIKLAKDNWDAPIIFTTMVQFLNTFYNGKSRNIRRLHNLSNSIIIFDEVQSVPVNCVSLFNEALNFLKNIANSTILLCTATQPALQYVQKNISIDGELIDDLSTVAKLFKRTDLISHFKDGGWTTEDLAEFVQEQLNSVNSVLVILNTKTVVKKLYQALKNSNVRVIHLSTTMCAAHRKAIINEMREMLGKEKLICISTQLIEAGVDVSFECVIRSLAGLDSIAQAAGRCNRHGEVERRNVYIINHAEEVLNKLPTIQKGGFESRKILKDIENDSTLFDGDILSEQAMTIYFRNFYQEFEAYLDYPTPVGKNIYEMLLGSNSEFVEEFSEEQNLWMVASFETAPKYFEVIDSKTHSVLVPYRNGKELIANLYNGEKQENVTRFFKEAQQYIVNVFDHDLNRLIQNGLLEKVEFKYASLYIAKESAYDDQYGLSVEGEASLDFMGY